VHFARVILAVWALGCAGTLPRAELADVEATAHAASLATSVEAVASGFTNFGRFAAVRRRASELGLGERARSEWIDWWSAQRNLVIELPGRTRELVYVVAHYDKIEVTPLAMASVFLNGLLDPVIAPLYTSSGAVDNATGVAVALELGAALAARDGRRFTYRILIAGSEEAGLRGSRAHVARISREERDAIALAVVVDTTGLRDRANCVADVSDDAYRRRADEAAADLGLSLGFEELPDGVSSDYAPFAKTGFWRDFGRGLMFNLVGGLLPQRSWFIRGSHEAPVVFFTSCDLIDWGDWIGVQLMLPLGRLHGPRDRISRVDPARLYEQYAIALRMLEDVEGGE
jgi:hypothetical protein